LLSKVTSGHPLDPVVWILVVAFATGSWTPGKSPNGLKITGPEIPGFKK
jgi:hypothetical protein